MKRPDSVVVNIKTIDNEVWSQLEHLFSDQSQFEHLIFKANAKLYKDKHTLDSIAESIVKIELALQDVDTQIENIIDSICAGSISKELVPKQA